MRKKLSKDFICAFALTSIFAVLSLFRLGNTYAPQSYYTADSENRDIILDFGS